MKEPPLWHWVTDRDGAPWQSKPTPKNSSPPTEWWPVYNIGLDPRSWIELEKTRGPLRPVELTVVNPR